MRNVQLLYRPEGPGWAVSSPQAPDYIAYAESLEEARKLAHEGIAFHFDVAESELQISDFVGAVSGLVFGLNAAAVVGAPAVSGALSLPLNVAESVVPSMAPTAVRQPASPVEAGSTAA